ncbi:ankyrin repeat domain-containing protein [Prosthecomicrobium sp. N25]|uniref:ankyrin repeat domain-containing protein n=1 Tax=Prosthecomicrobium sp. N25 TaxID=3129254 RepID=UPI003077EE01
MPDAGKPSRRRLARPAAALAGVLAWSGAAMTASALTPLPDATPLFRAAGAGDLPAVRDLLAGGMPADPRDGFGQTPLLLAVQGGHVEVAEALMAAGADVNAQAGNRDTPWLLAGALGRTAILKAMVPRGPDLTVRNRFGGNALIPACERGHVDAIAFLLTTGIDVDHVNDLGWTCLLEIVILGDGGPRHVEAARLVLAAGADPNLADRDGVTPLAHARARGQTRVAALIEAAGGRVAR